MRLSHSHKTQVDPIVLHGKTYFYAPQLNKLIVDDRLLCFALGEKYRYGFQGQEADHEIKGEGNSVNYKYRMHDARIGRFFAVDPLKAEYPHNSPYSFSQNIVVNSIELEGLEAVVVVTGITVGKGEASKHRGDYYMYKVEIYEGITWDEYLEANKSGNLKKPDATAVLARSAWGKASGRSSKRYGSYNETPPGNYYLEYDKKGFGTKKYKLKITEKKGKDYINGPDGKRTGIRIHRYSPHFAHGCRTTGDNSKKSVQEFIDKIPSLLEGKEVRIVIQERRVEKDGRTYNGLDDQFGFQDPNAIQTDYTFQTDKTYTPPVEIYKTINIQLNESKKA